MKFWMNNLTSFWLPINTIEKVMKTFILELGFNGEVFLEVQPHTELLVPTWNENSSTLVDLCYCLFWPHPHFWFQTIIGWRQNPLIWGKWKFINLDTYNDLNINSPIFKRIKLDNFWPNVKTDRKKMELTSLSFAQVLS